MSAETRSELLVVKNFTQGPRWINSSTKLIETIRKRHQFVTARLGKRPCVEERGIAIKQARLYGLLGTYQPFRVAADRIKIVVWNEYGYSLSSPRRRRRNHGGLQSFQ
jgi:hypothetical protein